MATRRGITFIGGHRGASFDQGLRSYWPNPMDMMRLGVSDEPVKQ
jgi:hypothetical protein